MKSLSVSILLTALLLAACCPARTQATANVAPASKVFLDTDIGDDIDDVFALGLLLSSPELKIVGISSAWGDTTLRSRMLDRILCETGREDIPVGTGISKTRPGAGAF